VANQITRFAIVGFLFASETGFLTPRDSEHQLVLNNWHRVRMAVKNKTKHREAGSELLQVSVRFL
jgi:hypothetical protein